MKVSMAFKQRAEAFVLGLQDAICQALEGVEAQHEEVGQGAPGTFREDRWERPGGGGGRSRVLEGGRVLEKAGVNVSAVWGEVPDAVKAQMPGDGDTFFATGVSLVLHPRNPHAPTTHANFRYLERGSVGWFGGGSDLTPYVLYEDDARHFHHTLRAACQAGAGAHADLYQRFKDWCDTYFWNTHRHEARGVGGIFFDHLRPETAGFPTDLDALWTFWTSAAESFLPAYLPILLRRKDTPATEAERTWQLVRRGRYVEFNLLHDRGTKFGLQTQGRIESIFMSLPPLVRWDYDVQVVPGSREAALLEVLAHPRDWT
ncbi:MAG: oxygen-dependent coproporphyrinogen oxidase [Deltaproteobacteria bacterium]|nr:oxygen-dependent coproporphyrinogen oxidase [Deltaproteobacteria bacterium]